MNRIDPVALTQALVRPNMVNLPEHKDLCTTYTARTLRKGNRKVLRDFNWYLYKERHVVECMFGRLKYCHQIATRFEKKASHFKEMLTFASVLLWLRWSSTELRFFPYGLVATSRKFKEN